MLRSYLTTAFRSFLSNKIHTAINVTGLALGLSGTLLIVLWIQNEWSYDRFHRDAEHLYRVMSNYDQPEGDIETYNVIQRSVAENINAKIQDVESLTQVIQVDRWPSKLCFKHGKDSPEECYYSNGIYADDNFFSTFSFPVVHGGEHPFTLNTNLAISETMAEMLFPQQDPIGKSLFVDNWLELKVAAVFKPTPPNSSLQFDFVLPFHVFRKLRGISNDQSWSANYLQTYLRTSGSVTLEVLQEKLDSKDVRTPDQVKEGASFFAQPLTDMRLYDKFENGKPAGGKIAYVQIFALIGMVVLSIACINFINLATARSIARGKEVGVRKVIGAQRRNLIFQFMGESFLTVITSMVLAVVLVQLAMPAFNALTGEALVIDFSSVGLQVLLLGILVVVSVLSGLYPAFVLSSFNPIKALKNKISLSSSGQTLRKALTVLQMTASVVMVIFASALFLQLRMIRGKDLGFDRQNIIHIEPTYTLMKKLDEFRAELLTDPAFQNLGASNGNLFDIENNTEEVQWPGKTDDQRILFRVLNCGPNFLETFNLSLVEGRSFASGVIANDALRPVVITEKAAVQMSLKDPVGARVQIHGQECEIIGVVKDIHSQSLHHEMQPTLFLADRNTSLSAVYVKYNGDADHALDALRKVYNHFESDFSMKYGFFDEAFDKQYKRELVMGKLTLCFTAVAIGISLLGILGLSTYNVLRRLREIGVRKVFGASAAQIVLLLSRDFIRLALIASLLACPVGAYFVQQWLSGFAYRVNIPWYIYGASSMTILLLTLITIGSQSLKAAVTNPSQILKDE